MFISCIIALGLHAQNNDGNTFILFSNEGKTYGINNFTGIKASALVKDSNNVHLTIICMFVNPTTNDTLMISAKDEAGFSTGKQHIFSSKSKLVFYYKIAGKGLFIKIMDNARNEIVTGNYFNISKLENKPGGVLEGSFAFTDIAFENNNNQIVTKIKAIKDGKFKTVVGDGNLFGNKAGNADNNSNNKNERLNETNEIFTSLEPNYLIKKIFKAVRQNNDGYFGWKPDFERGFDSTFLSDDGYAYTQYDTVLNYNDGIDKVLMFFTTVTYQNGEIKDCHACGALMSCALFSKQTNGYYKLNRLDTNFTQSIAWAKPDPVALVKTGANKYAIAIYSYDVHQGDQEEEVAFYEAENFKSIFTTQILDDNTWAALEKGYSNETKIKFLPAKNGSEYFILQAITSGTEENERRKIVPIYKKETYYFDTKKGEYVLQPKAVVK